MQNKFFGSKFNTALLFILIILMIIALKFMFDNKEVYFSAFQPKVQLNQEVLKTIAPLVPFGDWIKSPKFGLYYPKDSKIIEYYQLSPAQIAQGVPDTQGAPTFTATSSGNAIISWGGNQSACSQDELNNFQY